MKVKSRAQFVDPRAETSEFDIPFGFPSKIFPKTMFLKSSQTRDQTSTLVEMKMKMKWVKMKRNLS